MAIEVVFSPNLDQPAEILSTDNDLTNISPKFVILLAILAIKVVAAI